MDYSIQKAVELGVSQITPVISARSTIKLGTDRINKKIKHWQKISISACEQSGRGVLPVIHKPEKLASAINCESVVANEINLVLHPDARDTLNTGNTLNTLNTGNTLNTLNTLNTGYTLNTGNAGNASSTDKAGNTLPSRIGLLVGPESGLTADEITAAELAGFRAISLGPRVLRTETAGPALLAIIQYMFGDFVGRQ